MEAPWTAVVDLLWPRRCAGCGSAAAGEWLCCDCRRLLAPLSGRCPACGVPRPGGVVARCHWCQRPVPGLDRLRAATAYQGPAVAAVRRLKYRGQRVLARDLAGLMERPLDVLLAGVWPASPALVPVPLAPGRQRDRGYNQAELLARALAAARGLQCSTGLRRARETRAQVGLGPVERVANAEGAFEHRGPAPVWSILVDDVCTTGATLGASALALRRAGSHRVDAVVLCRG
ncbi:MAG: ComF family protein [Candidatus Dormibacteria bacterium]